MSRTSLWSWSRVGGAIFGWMALAGNSGCTTNAFCFRDCGENITTTDGASSTDGTTQNKDAQLTLDSGPILNLGDGAPDGAQNCAIEEICNRKDDNCNGQIDETFDFTDPKQCGTCGNDCNALLLGADPTSISCVPPPSGLGDQPGTCMFSKCVQDFWNADKDDEPTDIPGCEYYCIYNPDGTNTTDPGGATGCGHDDDCDGVIDEDVDTCSVTDCGVCGNNCVAPHATPTCKTTAAPGQLCTVDNTKCGIGSCDPDYYDLNGNVADGCEYQCTKTGPEICDGVDNDCDGLTDNQDPDLEAQAVTGVGATCYGGTDGECATAAHAGVKKCIDAAVTCCDVDSNNVNSTQPSLPQTGLRNDVCKGQNPPLVLRPGDAPEVCNGKDDDCDGVKDNSLTDTGGFCGSSEGTCIFGIEQCVSGKLTCVGGVTPQAFDPCNGQGADEDCDGIVDGTLAYSKTCATTADCAAGEQCLAHTNSKDLVCAKPCTTDTDCQSGQICLVKVGSSTGKACATPASNAGGPCNEPPPAPCVLSTGAPAGGTAPCAVGSPAPQGCSAGTLVCSAGRPVCQGAVLADPNAPDKCGEDTNCNGVLDNQPPLLTSVTNCGSCGNVCATSGDNVTWTCKLGVCNAAGCAPGFIDCVAGSPKTCETSCLYTGPEQCNGFDDDCNCQVDDGLTAPTPQQVCGVAQSATEAGCTTGTTVSCTAGAWKCTFPAGICTTGDCSTSPDQCDGIDNNCNGVADEGYKQPTRSARYLGQTCFTAATDGDCQGQGQYVCNVAGDDTVCNAAFQAGNATAEQCDGRDNDCDGVADEDYLSPGTNPSFVKPAVTSLGGGVWMFQYEASRPNASATTPGTGNGYHTSNPGGGTLDKTIACSVPGRLPWFNVTPEEAEQTCAAIGGQVCTLNDVVDVNGTHPGWKTACQAGAGCTWGYATSCTSPANYSTGPYCNLHPYDLLADNLLVTKSAALNQCYANWPSPIYDITGNLREITSNGTFYTLMGGAFNTEVETGATCTFDFLSVNNAFELFDTGFRCCFSSNPSP